MENAQNFVISGETGESKFKLIISVGSFFALPFMEIGIVTNLNPIRITRSKNSSLCTIKNIPSF